MVNKLLLEVMHLKKVFYAPKGEMFTILSDVNLQLFEEEKIAIVGESGSGKSTLLFLLGGLEKPDAGKVLWHGEQASKHFSKSRGGFLSYVFQNYLLIEELTLLENVLLPMRLLGSKIEKKQREKAQCLLEWLGLERSLHQTPRLLSGGERQRVAVARGLITQPKLLLADEPTGNLDAHTGEKVMELLISACEKTKTSLVLVTHNEHFSRKMDKTFRLFNGELVPCN